MCLMGAMNNSPLITDWIMVVITAIYVIATVLILLANRKAVKAAKEQLEESKREFEETRRLGLMPYICFSESSNSLTDYFCHLDVGDDAKRESSYHVRVDIKNIGLGTAKDITCLYCNFDNVCDIPFPIIALQNREHCSMRLIFHYPSDTFMYNTAYLVLRYKDLLDRAYEQKIGFEFDYDSVKEEHITRSVFTLPPKMVNN